MWFCCGEQGAPFSAGGDFDVLEQNARTDPETNRRRMLAFYRSYLSLLRLRVPSIAVLHGAAVGAGLCIAMACDFRIAADGTNFVRVGLHPGMGCTVLLPRLVGAAKASELMLGGGLVDGAEAARIGLVNRAVPVADLEAAVRAMVESLLRGAPVAVAQTKATLVMRVVADLEEALEREATCQAISFSTADLREAIAAFRESRAPVFEGR